MKLFFKFPIALIVFLSVVVYSSTAFCNSSPNITAPAPNAQLTSDTVTFQWSTAPGYIEFAIFLGTTQGGWDIYGEADITATQKTITHSAFSSQKQTVYVRLYYLGDGTNGTTLDWKYKDYAFNPTGSTTLTTNATETLSEEVNLLLNITKFYTWKKVFVNLPFETYHPQGIKKIGNEFFLTTVDEGGNKGYIIKFALTNPSDIKNTLAYEIKRVVLNPDNWRLQHPGGIDYNPITHKIWCPLAEYDSDGPSRILVINPTDLSFRDVGGYDTHFGTTIVDVENARIRMVDWDVDMLSFPLNPDGSFPDGTRFLRFHPSEGIEYQDCKHLDTRFAACAGKDPYRVDIIQFDPDQPGQGNTRYMITRKINVPNGLTQNPMDFEFLNDPSTGEKFVRFYFKPTDGNNTTLRIFDAYTHFLWGDLNMDGMVTMDELGKIVQFALGTVTPADQDMQRVSKNGDGVITINEIVTAVNNSLQTTNTSEIIAAMDFNHNGDVELDEIKQWANLEQAAQLTTPAPNLTLTASPLLFVWSVSPVAQEYWLTVSTSPLYTQGDYKVINQSMGMATSVSVNIPINNQKLYVWVGTKIGGVWYQHAYTFNTKVSSCFIATAAYGTGLEPQVQSLRNYRDTTLLKNEAGSEFVDWYYHTSPPIADELRKHDGLRSAVRAALTPVVKFTQWYMGRK